MVMRILVVLIFFSSFWHTSDTSVPKKSSKTTTKVSKSRNLKETKSSPRIGMVLDAYNGIEVYYNGDIENVIGRNTTPDGYNLGLKYQCVEFVKRYYYYHYKHKMPNTYGHAKQFFNPELPDRKYNSSRGLYQFSNGSMYPPDPGDILVFDGNDENPYGHIGIVTMNKDNVVEMIQQNVGQSTRSSFQLLKRHNKYYLADSNVLGWLRKA